MFPSKQWRNWVKETSFGWIAPYPWIPIREPVNCMAIFYRQKNIGDAVGFYQALADLLEICQDCKQKKRKCQCYQFGARVLDDDKWIVSWDGSRLSKDKDNPRIEVLLTDVRYRNYDKYED